MSKRTHRQTAMPKFPPEYPDPLTDGLPPTKVLESLVGLGRIPRPAAHPTPARKRQRRRAMISAHICHAFHGHTRCLNPALFDERLGDDPSGLFRRIFNDPRLQDPAVVEALRARICKELEYAGFDVGPLQSKMRGGIYRCIRSADRGMLAALVVALADTDYTLDESSVPHTDGHMEYLVATADEYRQSA